MKILFLTDDFPPESFGGAGIVASNLANAISAKGHEVVVLTTTQDNSKVGESVVDGIRIIKLYANHGPKFRNYLGTFNPFLRSAVAKVLKGFGPDIIHAHNIHYYFSFSILGLAKKYSKALFLTAHDSQSVSAQKVYPQNDRTDHKISPWHEMSFSGIRYNPLGRILNRYYLGFVDCIFAVSESLRSNLESNGIKNIQVMHNGIDIKQWANQPDKHLNIQSVAGDENNKGATPVGLAGKKVILFSGRLSGGKGAIRVLIILKEVLKKVPEAYLLILGKKGEYVNKMMKSIKELDIVDRVGFTGWVSGNDIRRAYQLSDVVVVPSIYLDPFPTVNLEAMAMSKAVVGTCFGGTQEVVEDGETGYIENPLDSAGFSDKIIRLLLDQDLNKKMGSNGRERIKDKFSLDLQVEKTLALYNKYLEKNGSR